MKVAVLLDGCFWHGCPAHATRPIRNGKWWARKLDSNIARDRRNDALLHEAGWIVLRFWEHEAIVDVVNDVIAVVGEPRPRRIGGSGLHVS
jgi:DNA mismatch endonuclease (patch repair protein)